MHFAQCRIPGPTGALVRIAPAGLSGTPVQRVQGSDVSTIETLLRRRHAVGFCYPGEVDEEDASLTVRYKDLVGLGDQHKEWSEMPDQSSLLVRKRIQRKVRRKDILDHT